MVSFDDERETNHILQTEYALEAYDEYLDTCVESAMSTVADMRSLLHDSFVEEADDFLGEIEKILIALEAAIQFTNEWKTSRINPQIDNTKN